MSNSQESKANAADTHLSEVPDGAGCTEIWEHLSEERESDETRDV